MITQCSIRHLYKDNTDPTTAAAIEVAKAVCERRRCGHHPDSFPEPLPTLECLSSVVDPGKSGTNKHRYCVATQDLEVRRAMRAVRGVPLVYVARSVMIMEPLSDATAATREREERGKFRDGIIRSRPAKRKRGDDDGEEGSGSGSGSESGSGDDERGEGEKDKQKKKKKRNYGPKGPNPLAVKKTKKEQQQQQQQAKKPARAEGQGAGPAPTNEAGGEQKAKRKRRKRRKAEGTAEGTDEGAGEGAGEGAATQTAEG